MSAHPVQAWRGKPDFPVLTMLQLLGRLPLVGAAAHTSRAMGVLEERWGSKNWTLQGKPLGKPSKHRGKSVV